LPVQPWVHGFKHLFHLERAAEKIVGGPRLRSWIGDQFIVVGISRDVPERGRPETMAGWCGMVANLYFSLALNWFSC